MLNSQGLCPCKKHLLPPYLQILKSSDSGWIQSHFLYVVNLTSAENGAYIPKLGIPNAGAIWTIEESGPITNLDLDTKDTASHISDEYVEKLKHLCLYFSFIILDIILSNFSDSSGLSEKIKVWPCSTKGFKILAHISSGGVLIAEDALSCT